MDLADAFATLMRLNKEAFTAGHYAAAYHALEAALDIAAIGTERPWLEQVADRALKQANRLDASPPDLTEVPGFSVARGNRELFQACAATARDVLANRD